MEELYDCYGTLVYRRIYAMVQSAPVAEDLTQEVFLRVWRNARTFDEERGSMYTWISALARNIAIDYVRSKGCRLERRTVPLDPDFPIHPGLTCENDAVHFDLFGRLGRAVAKLNLNQRTVLEMAFHEGLSHTEMAIQLQQPLGTIKTRIRRALQSLRVGMLECGEA